MADSITLREPGIMRRPRRTHRQRSQVSSLGSPSIPLARLETTQHRHRAQPYIPQGWTPSYQPQAIEARDTRAGRARSGTVRHYTGTTSKYSTAGEEEPGKDSAKEDTRQHLETLREQGSILFGKQGAAIQEHSQIPQRAHGKVSSPEARLSTLQQEYPDMINHLKQQLTLEVRQQYEQDQRMRDKVIENEWNKLKEGVTQTMMESLHQTQRERAEVEKLRQDVQEQG